MYSYQESGVTGHLVTPAMLYVEQTLEREPERGFVYLEMISVMVRQVKLSPVTMMPHL